MKTPLNQRSLECTNWSPVRMIDYPINIDVIRRREYRKKREDEKKK